MASRILGMGDVESLIEKAQAAIDEEKALEMEKKLRKASFDFNDFLEQMEQMEKMGGMGDILKMLPGFSSNKQLKDLDIDESAMNMPKAIIYSMTPQERSNPDIITPSRKKRIANGAGVDISEVNKLLKQFEQSKKMMKQMSGMMGGKKRGGFKLPFGF
jgi:signal recognition particle subunit SRP54